MQLLKALLVVSSVASACGQATVTVTDAAGFSTALANAGTAQIVVSADLLLDGRAGPMTIGPRRAPLQISGDTATGDRALVGNGWRMFTINDEGVCIWRGRLIFVFASGAVFVLSGTAACARPHHRRMYPPARARPHHARAVSLTISP